MGTRTFLTRQAMETISFYARATQLHALKKNKSPFFTRYFSFKINLKRNTWKLRCFIHVAESIIEWVPYKELFLRYNYQCCWLLGGGEVKGFSWVYEGVRGEKLNREDIDLVDFCYIFTFKMGEAADLFEGC